MALQEPLLLTDRKKIEVAENTIDDVIQYIESNPDVKNETTILGEEIRRANWVNITESFTGGYNNFLESKAPQMVVTNPFQNGTSIVNQPPLSGLLL